MTSARASSTTTGLTEFAVRFPATLELSLAAPSSRSGSGSRGGLRPACPGWIDGGVRSSAAASASVFVLGLVLVIFAVQLRWLPTGSRIDPRAGLELSTNFVLVDSLLQGRPDLFVDGLRHLVLPAIALGSIPLAIIARITRAAVLDVANEDYVRTARAKGLTERRVDNRHVMRNAWLPVVTVIGLQVGGLLGGAVLTETVFAWNGVGRWVVDAIQGRDYFVVHRRSSSALLFLAVNLVSTCCTRSSTRDRYWMARPPRSAPAPVARAIPARASRGCGGRWRRLLGTGRRCSGWCASHLRRRRGLALLIAPYGPYEGTLAVRSPPSRALLGTDLQGRDLLSRSVRRPGQPPAWVIAVLMALVMGGPSAWRPRRPDRLGLHAGDGRPPGDRGSSSRSGS